MQLLVAILAAMLAPPGGAQALMAAPAPACAGEKLTPANCEASEKEIRQARKAFERGVKAQERGRSRAALQAFERAADLLPRNVEYAIAREFARQQAVMEHVRRGDALLLQRDRVRAAAEFRQALDVDSSNQYAFQRLRSSLQDEVQRASAQVPPLVAAAELAGPESTDVRPNPGKQGFNYRGDSRGLITEIGRAFGVTPIFDDSMRSRQVKFAIDDVDFYTAMAIAGQMTNTFWVPMGDKHVLVATENTENRRSFDRQAMRTFYITDATTQQELNDLLNTVRVIFDVRYISPSTASRTLTIRAPRRTLDLVTRLLTGMEARKPQVMLHVQAFEVNRSMLRSLGIELPLQFQVFNISAAALALAGRPDIQDLINELISSGGINQADAEAIQALLAQLQNQQQSILSQPIATFGGGITLFGVTIPPISARAQLNESRVQRIDEALLRTGQGDAATFKSGVRFPILNATFAPILNTPDLARVIGEGSFQTPFPSFTYEDIGLTLKVTPRVQQDALVELDFDLQIRALGTQQLNSIPVIVNREFKTAMTLRSGEPAIIAGMMGDLERRALRGIPGFSKIPVLGMLGSTREKEQQETQLLVLVTPYVVGVAERAQGGTIYTRDLPQPGGSR